MTQRIEYLDAVALTAWLAHTGYVLFDDIKRDPSLDVFDRLIMAVREQAAHDAQGRVPVSVLRGSRERRAEREEEAYQDYLNSNQATGITS